MHMKTKIFFYFSTFIFLFALIINPQSESLAQGGCFDASGGPIPCTSTPEPDEPEEVEKTSTPVPPTFTYTPTLTPTNTFTSTATQTPSTTSTSTNTATPTFTPTATITPMPTLIPPANIVLSGVGIGALILFLIVGVLFPIIQRVRVRRRGY